MSRKVFISFLGASNYGPCDYMKDGKSYGGPLRFVQVATLHYLQSLEPWTGNDVAYILLTKTSESNNWVDDGQKNHVGEIIRQSGLKTQLDAMNLAFPVIPVKELPDGNDEREIWEIFNRVFEVIQDGDALYLDITHGYRYLPTLMLVLSNYSKFLKNVSVKSITYGNYEVSERGTKPGLIVDLLPLSALQDWTYAAGQYLDSGNVSKLVELSKKALNPILRDDSTRGEGFAINAFVKNLSQVIDERIFCRGIDIINSKSFGLLKSASDSLESTIIEPLNPIFEKIKASLSAFDTKENISNGYEAAKWCLTNGLYQQAVTILDENIVTDICREEGLDWRQEIDRSIVSTAFNVKLDNKEEEEDKWFSGPRYKEEEKELLIAKTKHIFENQHFAKIIHYYGKLRDLRNDYNHSGMRNNPIPSQRLKGKIESLFSDMVAVMNNETATLTDFSNLLLLINLSNHPNCDWSQVQKEMAMQEYGDIIDLPFPAVSPDSNEEAIEVLSEQYMDKIHVLAKGCKVTVHVMGEMTFTMAMVRRLQAEGITCVASTTERIVKELPDGRKESCFRFVRFRQYR